VSVLAFGLPLIACAGGVVMGYWGSTAVMRRRIVVDKPAREIVGRQAVQLGVIYLVFAAVMLGGGGLTLFDSIARWAGWKP
jgi:hypothetical protein